MASRKSRRQRAEEKRQKFTRTIMSVVIIVLFAASSAAFAMNYFSPNAGQTNFRYTQTEDGLIQARLGGEQILFYSLPDTSIPIPEGARELLSDKNAIIVTFDPSLNESLQFVEVARFDFDQYLDGDVIPAVTEPSDLYPFPTLSCDNATSQIPVVAFVNGTRSVSLDGSCLTLAGGQFDFIYLRDQILYDYFEVR